MSDAPEGPTTTAGAAWPAAVTFGTAALGVALAWVAGFRVSAAVVGLASLLAAVLRGVLGPAAGLLVVRSSWLDVTLTSGLGVGLLVLAALVPGG